MRPTLLVAFAFALLASPALGQQRASMGVSVRILPALQLPAASHALAQAPLEVVHKGRIALPVKRGWTWSLVAAAGDARVPLAVELCREGRCARAPSSGRAATGPAALAVELAAAVDGVTERGTLTYLIAPL